MFRGIETRVTGLLDDLAKDTGKTVRELRDGGAKIFTKDGGNNGCDNICGFPLHYGWFGNGNHDGAVWVRFGDRTAFDMGECKIGKCDVCHPYKAGC